MNCVVVVVCQITAVTAGKSKSVVQLLDCGHDREDRKMNMDKLRRCHNPALLVTLLSSIGGTRFRNGALGLDT